MTRPEIIEGLILLIIEIPASALVVNAKGGKA
jgi:hypothetical protein